ncbi:MAG TPA: acetylornithine deacetylase/succinyl-diaminopimelate desuccinylase family protein [Paracoccaceae bacterium]|nr:acetylornithine deacetylase/succinyl-diaminopimelate desuccinylase family protein [Paracoccaceae bacterium]HMO71057.1 acetylornithine deacetylase/succinyl-diaminopimelate desuccinylase family protein [Paracoccaceae bacterium]
MSDTRLMAEIDARRARLILLAQDLVRIPTLNPPGARYREICEYLGARLAAQGWDVDYVRAIGSPGDSDAFPRWNMVARAEGTRPGPCVHFNGHHDVVEVGHGWTRDPFAATVEGDRLYGRGACDMKGGLAAAVIAAEAFRAAHPDHAGAIEVSATADEESGGFGGVAYLAEHGWFAPGRVDHVIIPEPLHKDRICIGHRGVLWVEIETKGRIAHGSMPFLGDSAIAQMAEVLHEIEHRLKPRLAERVTDLPVVPEGARAATLNVNSIHGGAPEPAPGDTALPAPCVADRCRIVIDRRWLMEEEAGAVRGELTALMDGIAARRPGFAWEMRELFEVAPVMAPQDAPVVRSTAAAIERVVGRHPEFVASPGTYDQKHIDRIGRLSNCIAYGPGLLHLAHQPDEWVGISDMLDSARVMALVLADLLEPAG